MDVELYYQEKGSGEPLILLHGNGEDSTYFKYQMDHFQSSCRVIALDTRGHGKSPRGIKPFAIEQFACDLYGFMKSHEISSAVILGFSDGANIAMKFAMRHPDMVKALILNGGDLNAKGVRRTTQLPIEIGYRMAAPFAKKSPDAEKNAEMLGLMVNEPNLDLCELSRITAPSLVICGTRDMIKGSHTREIASGIPNAELTIIKGSHFVANQQPTEFNRVVDDFLKRLLE